VDRFPSGFGVFPNYPKDARSKIVMEIFQTEVSYMKGLEVVLTVSSCPFCDHVLLYLFGARSFFLARWQIVLTSLHRPSFRGSFPTWKTFLSSTWVY